MSPTSTMVRATDAAAIAGISPQRLHYWERTALVRPTVDRELSHRKRIRLYDINDLTTLLVVADLVNHPSISLQHVRRVADRLREYGYARPLSELTFRIDHDEIVFQHPDGTWEGSSKPSQTLDVTVRIDLDELHGQAMKALERPRRIGRSRIEKRRGVLASKPVLADTRIPVTAVQSYLSRGYSDEEILLAYPELEQADIDEVRGAREAYAI